MGSAKHSRARVVMALWLAAAATACKPDGGSPEDDAFAGPLSASASAAGAASSVAAPAVAGSGTPSRDASELDIRERGPDDFEIELDAAIAVQIDLRSGALVLTKLPTGYRLERAAEGSLPARLGLKQGDELISLNDVLLLDAASADRGYQQGLSSERFRLLLKRAGEQRSVRYRLNLGRTSARRPSRYARRDPLTPHSSYRAPFDDVVDALKTGVKSKGANSFELDRELFALFSQHPRLLSRRIYDTKLHGGGARAASTFESVLTAIGLTRGDIVQHVAGDAVTSQKQLVTALTAAAKLSSFSMSVYRRDAGELEIKFTVVAGLLDQDAANQAIERWNGSGGASPPLTRSRAPRLPPTRSSSRSTLDISSLVSVDPSDVIEVKTEALTRILDDRRAMLIDVRAIPSYQDGKAIGLKLIGVRPRSPAHVLGFRNGDVVKTVDGRKLYTLRTFVRALKQAPLKATVEVALKRRGRDKTLRFRRL